ncbi:MAG: hypothetical protein JW870_10315 [Candidatus Delongbacteria bacterium]|nr:hypothetical protein [Candidatus Delongbacteria bacterium]
MHKTLLIILVFFFSCSVYGQHDNKRKILYNLNKERVINLSNINSEYDDINVYFLLYETRKDILIFSTSRASNGQNFDLISYKIKLHFDTRSRKGFIRAKEQDSDFLNMVNSDKDEFGPCIVFDHWYKWKYFSYTSNKSGSDNIYLINILDLDNNKLIAARDEVVSHSINTDSNEGYLSYNILAERSFTYQSDEKGDFDINGFSIPDSLNKLEKIPYIRGKELNLDSLNTTWNEKFPYTKQQVIVFCSDRPGGHGGYDIYYAKWNYDLKTYGTPRLFNNKINSPKDEFRPFLIEISGITFLIFSSNRDNGLGGFDLYFASINDIVYPDYLYGFTKRNKWYQDDKE